MKEQLKSPRKPEEISPEEVALHARLTTLASRIDTIIDREIKAKRGKTVDRKTIATFEVDKKPKVYTETASNLGYLETGGKLKLLLEKTTTKAGLEGPFGKSDFIVQIDENVGITSVSKQTLSITIFDDGQPPTATYLTTERGEIGPNIIKRPPEHDLLARIENVIDRLPVPALKQKKAARRARQ